MTQPELKQYGLHRSGTNFLRVILQENYHVTVLTTEGGWKHGRFELVQKLGHELDCLLCVKNPYSWLVSLHRYRHPENDMLFPQFVRSEIRVVGQEAPDDAIVSANPIRLWSEMNQHWLGAPLMSHRWFVFRYEDVLAAPYDSIQELVGALKLERKQPIAQKLKSILGTSEEPEFFVPPRQLGALKDQYKKRNLERGVVFDASQYTRHEYLKSFTPELLKFVNENLDPGIVNRLGYSVVSDLQNPPV